MKKILLGTLATTSFLSANDCCCSCGDNLYDCEYAITDGWDLTGTVSILLWKPQEEGLDYAIKNEWGTTLLNNAKVKEVNSDLDWGFRLGLGYQIPCCQMDLTATWTRFSGGGSSSTTSPPFGELYSIWSVPGNDFSPIEKAKGIWHLRYNQLDLSVGGSFLPRCFLNLRPYFGLTTAWIRQKFDIEMDGDSPTLEDEIEMRNHFWGIGPKVGLDTMWKLGCGFSFFGNLNASLLYGKFKISQKEKITSLIPIKLLDLSDPFWLSRLILDLNIGLRWDMVLFCDCYHFSIEAGWENLFFPGQNQLRRFQASSSPGTSISTQGDLTIQGLTLRASFTF